MDNKILDFRMNANPFGPPKWARSVMRDSSSWMIDYPDYKNVDVNQAIASLLSLPIENVAVANGSLEAIFLIPRLVDSSKNAIIVPTYWGYAAALESMGLPYEKVILSFKDNFAIALETLGEIAARSSLLFICNPNNPTSTYISKKDLLKVVKDFPNCHFFVDEAHLLLKDMYEQETLAREAVRRKNLTIIYSTSKLYNVGGLRTGIVVSNSKLIEGFKKIQVPYSFGSIQQKVFTRLLNDKEFTLQTRSKLERVTKELAMGLQSLNWLKVMPSTTHFLLCEIRTKSITAIGLADRLLADGFGIRECTTSYSELEGEWIRITANTRSNNKKLIDALKNYNIN